MATVFGSDGSLRGCFIAFDIDMANSLGALVQLPQSSSIGVLPDRSTGSNYPLVVTSVGFNQSERKFFMKCFGDNIYTYSFGNDVGQIQVDMVAFLAKGVTFNAEGSGTAVDRSAIIDSLNAYNTSRLSRSRERAIVSLGQNGSVSGFITAMNVSTHDTESNMMRITMTLNMVEVQGDIDNEQTTQQVPAPGASAAAAAAGTLGAAGAGAAAALNSLASLNQALANQPVTPVPGATLASLAASAAGTPGVGASIALGTLGSLNRTLSQQSDVPKAARKESQTNRSTRTTFQRLSLSDQNAARLASESSYDVYTGVRSNLSNASRFETLQVIDKVSNARLTLATNLATENLA